MKKALALLILLSLLAPVVADESPFSFELLGVRFKWGVVPTGLDIALGYSLGATPQGAPARLQLSLGGAYEDLPLTRSDADGSPLAPGSFGVYDGLDFQGELLFGQFLPIKDASGDFETETWVAWRSGWWDDTGPDVASHFLDRNRLLMHSLALGLTHRGAETSEHMIRDGIDASFTAEWGPSFLNPGYLGGADFARATGEASFWLPLWDLKPEAALNVLSLQACARLVSEYCAGSDVPLIVGQFFGGRRPGQTLGYAVRGYEWGQFDAAFKAVANAELRLLGPALFGKKNLMPILYGWFDAGAYSGYHEAPAASADLWGLPMSFGLGLAVDVLGLAQPALQLAFPLTSEAKNGILGLNFQIKFSLQF